MADCVGRDIIMRVYTVVDSNTTHKVSFQFLHPFPISHYVATKSQYQVQWMAWLELNFVSSILLTNSKISPNNTFQVGNQ